MRASDLAALHASAMTVTRPWSQQEFQDLLAQSDVFHVSPLTEKYPGGARGGNAPSPERRRQAAQSLVGFAIGRLILDEVELLTLAVAPNARRRGIGRACLGLFENEATHRGVQTAFLEVAATNAPAIALYTSHGWHQTGIRKAYYKGPSERIDAILMSKRLAHG